MSRSANGPDVISDNEGDSLLSSNLDQQVRGFWPLWTNATFDDDGNKPKDYTAKNTKDNSFRVLGVDIGGWSRTAQYVFCASGVVFFLLLYGILQEYVVMAKFKRSLGWFVTFLQLSGYASTRTNSNTLLLILFSYHRVLSVSFNRMLSTQSKVKGRFP